MKFIKAKGTLNLTMVPKHLRDVSITPIDYMDRSGHYFYVMAKNGIGFRVENNHPRHVRHKFAIAFGLKNGYARPY